VAALEGELATLRLKGVKPIDLIPDEFKVGQVGYMAQGDTKFEFRVARVLDGKQMIMEIARTRFLVRGFPTEGLADGQKILLPGVWRIAGTARLDGRTYLVAEPFTATPKKKAADPAEGS
jgi:hypothetical protein